MLGNILPDSTAAPGLQANQKSLEKHMKADSLEQKIQRRPTAEQLVQEGILEEGENPTKQ
jgi:RPEL repeat